MWLNFGINALRTKVTKKQTIDSFHPEIFDLLWD